jgi:hypothetical protein
MGMAPSPLVTDRSREAVRSSALSNVAYAKLAPSTSGCCLGLHLLPLLYDNRGCGVRWGRLWVYVSMTVCGSLNACDRS